MRWKLLLVAGLLGAAGAMGWASNEVPPCCKCSASAAPLDCCPCLTETP